LRLPAEAHTGRPWRIHELARDFHVEDVWALPTPGGPDDFPLAVRVATTWDPSNSGAWPVRVLFEARWKIGALLGWDGDGRGLGSRVPTVYDRLPPDLRDRPGPEFAALPFRPLYLLEDEFAAEIANRTMHGVMHLSWVPDGAGAYRSQMAVLVKRNGWFGDAYMAAIDPVRRFVVYPAAMRETERAWRRLAADPAASPWGPSRRVSSAPSA
jgi:hypothetical protein